MKLILHIMTLFIMVMWSSKNAKYSHLNSPVRVVFHEDFEAPSLPEVFSNWDDIKNGAGMSFSRDVPTNSNGKQSLMMTYTPGENDGGHLYKLFPRGFDSLYARFYIKFLTHHSKIHHLVQMGGNYPASKWPKGGAGIRPKGDDTFITSIEPLGNKWEWGFYSYWMNMHSGPDSTYYGNVFTSTPPEKVELGKWICVEFMIKLNCPVNTSDGEQALWINGEKTIHIGKGYLSGYWIWGNFQNNQDSTKFEGLRWRNSDQLKINFFWLSYYLTDGKEGEIDKVLFDDVVISTRYIGPNYFTYTN